MALNDRLKNVNSGKVMLVLVGLICLFLLATALKLMAPVLVPLTVAVLLSIVLDPIVSGLEKLKIPRPVGISIVVMLIGGVLYLSGVFLLFSARQFISSFSKYELRLSIVYENIAALLRLPYDDQVSVMSNLLSLLDVNQRLQRFAIDLSNYSLSLLGNLGVVLFFMVFLMFERAHFKSKMLIAFEGKVSGKIRSISAAIVKQTVRYLSVKFLISLATGVFAYMTFLFVGLDFAPVWASLVFAFNFIPNIGSIAAGVGASMFALVQFWPEPAPIVVVSLGLLLINQVLGNIVEPKVVGESLDLSPFILLVSLATWGWLWGFMGLVLAVPMTVVIKIVCENIPLLEPVSVMMGSYRALRDRRAQPKADAKTKLRQKK